MQNRNILIVKKKNVQKKKHFDPEKKNMQNKNTLILKKNAKNILP